MAAFTILGVIYGLSIRTKDDPHVLTAEAAMRSFSLTSNQGAYLGNSVPALKYVPEWVPGECDNDLVKHGMNFAMRS